RVNFALAQLAAAPVERVGAAAELEPDRHRAEREIAPHRVEQVAPVALRKLVSTVPEHDKSRRPGLHLRDVAELNPLPLGRRGRIGLDRHLEPAVELARRYTAAPRVAQVERDLEDRVGALSGLAR